jgi:hypothetical protein
VLKVYRKACDVVDAEDRVTAEIARSTKREAARAAADLVRGIGEAKEDEDSDEEEEGEEGGDNE